ncbi:MAG: RnfABCDGE type electron transport complex subunit B [Desulforhabdus sp.]|nr:RnfABCDGE type electron transport complex subunit B [Desulforhabdus sp.]
MIWVTVTLAAATLVGMAVAMSYILGWANRAFQVQVDSRVEAVIDVLPGANCGGCGYVGCSDYAEAVVTGRAPVDKCSVGGNRCAAAVAEIMGVEVAQSWPYRPIVHCGAHYGDRLFRSEYRGEASCTAANLVAGVQGCTYGCLGFGDCARACDFNAIDIIDGLATVDYNKCVGCGACARACPRNIISMIPFKYEQMLAVTCSNKDIGEEVKIVCKVGCIGCRACSRFCSLFTFEENLPAIDYASYCTDFMDQLEKAVKKCPRKGIVFMGKPSPRDLEAVEDQPLPRVIEADFKTTVDDTEWRG